MNSSFFVQSDEITLRVASGVATVIFSRPSHLNALSSQAVLALGEVLRRCEESQDVSIIILRGAGERAFSAGADVRIFESFKDIHDAEFFWKDSGPKIHSFIEKMTKPVISVISGYCLGGGLEIALACDLSVATKDSKFGFPEVNLGLLPGWGGTQRITRILGRLKAKQLVMLGEMIEAEEAARLGMVNWVVNREELEDFVNGLVAKLTKKSPLVLAYAKDAVNRAYETTLQEGLAYEAELDTRLIATEDAKEGIRSFLEKRKPVFSGK